MGRVITSRRIIAHMPARLSSWARPRLPGSFREKKAVSSMAPQAEKEASMAPHMGRVPLRMGDSTSITLTIAARYHALVRITIRAITSASMAQAR